MKVKSIIHIFLGLLVVTAVNGANVDIQDSEHSRFIDNTIYYVIEPKFTMDVSNIQGNFSIYIDSKLQQQAEETGEFTFKFPTNKFELSIMQDSSLIYSRNFTPEQISIDGISTSIESSSLQSKNEIKYKVQVQNDNIPKSDVKIVSMVYDSSDNLIKEDEKVFSLSTNVAKYFNFIPEQAGEYKIKNKVYVYDLFIEENEKLLEIDVTRPEITMTLSQDSIILPNDVAANIFIKNAQVERDLEILLQVMNPNGDIIEEEEKTIEVSKGSSQTTMFPFSVDEDQVSGEYLVIARTTFQEGGKKYYDEKQRTFVVNSPTPKIDVKIQAPKLIEVSEQYKYYLTLTHMSTKQFEYEYQCSVFDNNDVLMFNHPNNYNQISLSSQERRDVQNQFTIPADFNTGKYKMVCSFYYQNEKFFDEVEFDVTQPSNYVNMRVSTDYSNKISTVKIGYSTKSIKEIIGKLDIELIDEDGKVIDSDYANEITLTGKLQTFKHSFKIPDDIAPQDLRVAVEMTALDEETEEIVQVIESKDNLELYCSNTEITPQNQISSCSIGGITSNEGKVYIGIVRDGVDIPRIFRPNNKAILINSQERDLIEEYFDNETNLTQTRISDLSFTIDFKSIKDSKVDVAAIFVDENEISTSTKKSVNVIPVGARFGNVKTYTDDEYFKDDMNMPLSNPGKEFRQDIQIVSNSNEPLEIMIKPVSPNEDIIYAGDSQSFELAPGSRITKIFLHEQTDKPIHSIVSMTYQMFLKKDGKTILLDQIEAEAIAPKQHWAISGYITKKKDDGSTLKAMGVVGIILAAVFVIYSVNQTKRRRQEGTSDMQSNSTKPHEPTDRN